jgi:uncharacterized damage-inducible protein DinB
MNHLLAMLNYDKWANDRVLTSIESAEKVDAKAVTLFSHIIAAQEVWMSRVKNRAVESAWKERTLEECKLDLQKSFDEYLEFLSWLRPDELKRSIEYKDSAGNQWSNTLREIFTHVCNHGTYHRGQIATLVRSSGAEPAATDYIAMARMKEEQ